jgi:hypothetical protein
MSTPSTLGADTPGGAPPLGSLFGRSPSSIVSGATGGTGTGEEQKLRAFYVSKKVETCGGLIGGTGISVSFTNFFG